MNAINWLFLDYSWPATAFEALGSNAGSLGTEAAKLLIGNPAVLATGIGLVIVAAVVFFFLKKIIVNSILGVIAWAVLTYVFQIQLPFIQSLAVSVIFGPAGIGVMLVLRFFGLL